MGPGRRGREAACRLGQSPPPPAACPTEGQQSAGVGGKSLTPSCPHPRQPHTGPLTGLQLEGSALWVPSGAEHPSRPCAHRRRGRRGGRRRDGAPARPLHIGRRRGCLWPCLGPPGTWGEGSPWTRTSSPGQWRHEHCSFPPNQQLNFKENRTFQPHTN